MQGGELAGDLGWLDKDKGGDKALSVEQQKAERHTNLAQKSKAYKTIVFLHFFKTNSRVVLSIYPF